MQRSSDSAYAAGPTASVQISAVTLRKVTWRLIPFLFILYVIAWLDRVNVGFAGLQMNADLGFSSTVFGFGSGIFFLGYCLFEIPSNIILERVGARLWISRIMVTWGLISVRSNVCADSRNFLPLTIPSWSS
jgi:ACS family tartrate transporter-like MFS transporter